MELLRSFVSDFLMPFAGNPHLGLFLVVWFSAIFPLAPPEEAFTLLGGAAVATGILSAVPTGLAILGGIIATNITLYWMGRAGLKVLSRTRLGQRIIAAKAFQRAHQAMQARGLWAIVACRFFFGARSPTYVATGFFRYRFWKFAAIDALIVLLHGIPFLVLGYLFHDQIDTIIEVTRNLGSWSLAVLAVLIAAAVVAGRLRRRSAEQSEQEA